VKAVLMFNMKDSSRVKNDHHQEHPSQQNSVAPVRAQQGWRATVQRVEHGGLYAQPIPCDHQQRTMCGWHQGYPFVSDCYALVGASCISFCPSTRISRLCTRKPAPLLLHNFFLARNICTTSFSHPILVRTNRHLIGIRYVRITSNTSNLIQNRRDKIHVYFSGVHL